MSGRLTFTALLVCICTAAASIGWAGTYSVTIPINGPYSPGDVRYCDLDFGRQFASISSVMVSVNCYGHSSWTEDVYHDITTYPLEWGLNIGDAPYPYTTHSGGLYDSWDPAYRQSQEFVYDEVLDGRTRAVLSVSAAYNHIPGIHLGWLMFSSASLTVVGVEAQVPEPGACAFVLCWGIPFAFSYRRRK
jgi:hypothetical protein